MSILRAGVEPSGEVRRQVRQMPRLPEGIHRAGNACRDRAAACCFARRAGRWPVDELALQEMDHKPDGGPPDPTALEVCPGCGAKWKIGAKECKKCHYNAIVGAKLRPPLKSRHGILSNFDIQKMFLYAAIAAIAFGIYWLVTNFDSLKRKGNDWYDNASRSRPTETDDTVMIRKDAPKVEKD
jgi:ribosomal protein L40E